MDSVNIQFPLQPQGREHHFLLLTYHENWDHSLISGLGEWVLKQSSKCHETRNWITNTNVSRHRPGCKIQTMICTISLMLFRCHLSAKVTTRLSPLILTPHLAPLLCTLFPQPAPSYQTAASWVSRGVNALLRDRRDARITPLLFAMPLRLLWVSGLLKTAAVGGLKIFWWAISGKAYRQLLLSKEVWGEMTAGPLLSKDCSLVTLCWETAGGLDVLG